MPAWGAWNLVLESPASIDVFKKEGGAKQLEVWIHFPSVGLVWWVSAPAFCQLPSSAQEHDLWNQGFLNGGISLPQPDTQDGLSFLDF